MNAAHALAGERPDALVFSLPAANATNTPRVARLDGQFERWGEAAAERQLGET